MRPVTVTLLAILGLALGAAGCERDRTRLVPSQKPVEVETTKQPGVDQADFLLPTLCLLRSARSASTDVRAPGVSLAAVFARCWKRL